MANTERSWHDKNIHTSITTRPPEPRLAASPATTDSRVVAYPYFHDTTTATRKSITITTRRCHNKYSNGFFKVQRWLTRRFRAYSSLFIFIYISLILTKPNRTHCTYIISPGFSIDLKHYHPLEWTISNETCKINGSVCFQTSIFASHGVVIFILIISSHSTLRGYCRCYTCIADCAYQLL